MTTNLILSTNLIGVDGVYCTYWGLGSNLIDDWLINEDFKDGHIDYNSEYFWRNYNHSAFMDDWAEQVYNHIESILKDVFKYHLQMDVNLEYKGYWSPREYNFSHDVVNFDIDCSEGWDKLIDFCTTHPDFSKFLKDHYSSYDGFTSFTANNVDTLLEDIAVEDMTAYGAMITFLLSNFASDDIRSIDFEIYYQNYFEGSKDLDEIIEDLKNGSTEELEYTYGVDSEMREHLLNKYIALNKDEVLSLYNLDFDAAFEILKEKYPNIEDITIIKYMNMYWNEVDNKTANLFSEVSIS